MTRTCISRSQVLTCLVFLSEYYYKYIFFKSKNQQRALIPIPPAGPWPQDVEFVYTSCDAINCWIEPR